MRRRTVENVAYGAALSLALTAVLALGPARGVGAAGEPVLECPTEVPGFTVIVGPGASGMPGLPEGCTQVTTNPGPDAGPGPTDTAPPTTTTTTTVVEVPVDEAFTVATPPPTAPDLSNATAVDPPARPRKAWNR